jgi:hypothetical protein
MSPPSTMGGRYSDRLAVAAAAATTTIPGPDRPTTLPRRGRSTVLARFARSSTLRSGSAAPGLRYPACTGLVTRAATSRRAMPGTAARAPSPPWSPQSNGLDAATRFPSSGASRRRYHPRATVVGHADGSCPLPPDPALACLLRRGRAAGPPTPHAVSLSRPRFIEPRRPSPASPAGSAPEPLA